MFVLVGTHQLVDVWKRNATIEPYEGILHNYNVHACIILLLHHLYHLPLYLPYAVFHNEVRCDVKLFL